MQITVQIILGAEREQDRVTDVPVVIADTTAAADPDVLGLDLAHVQLGDARGGTARAEGDAPGLDGGGVHHLAPALDAHCRGERGARDRGGRCHEGSAPRHEGEGACRHKRSLHFSFLCIEESSCTLKMFAHFRSLQYELRLFTEAKGTPSYMNRWDFEAVYLISSPNQHVQGSFTVLGLFVGNHSGFPRPHRAAIARCCKRSRQCIAGISITWFGAPNQVKCR
jgi:hypothetical protein